MIPDQQLIAESWSLAAGSGYGELLVPRFAPWTVDALDEVRRLLPASPRRRENEGIDRGGGGGGRGGNKSGSGSESPRRRRCWVPCCGPGHELLPLSTALGDGWSVLGVDLAPGMIDEANRLLNAESDSGSSTSHHPERRGNVNVVRAVVGDCSTVPGPDTLPRLEDGGDDRRGHGDDEDRHFDLIFSVFGLQQMPDPLAVLRTWISALRPPGSSDPGPGGPDHVDGGVAVICFWPAGEGQVETEGPWARWADVFRRKLANSLKEPDGNGGGRRDDDGSSSPAPSQNEPCWSDGAVLARAAEDAGAEVLRNDLLSHEIVWDGGPAQLWDAMTMAGPWRAARLRWGDDFVDGLRGEYCSAYGPGEPVVHSPRARLLVLRRK